MAITITINPTVAAVSATTPIVVTGAGGTTWSVGSPPTFTISGTGNSVGAVTVQSTTKATVLITLASTASAFTLTDTLAGDGSPTATLTGIVVPIPNPFANVPQYAVISTAILNLSDVVVGVPGYFITVGSYLLVAGATTANTVTWESHTAGAITGAMLLGASGNPTNLSASDRHGLFQTANGESLALNLSAATSIVGHLTYWLTRAE